MPLRLQKPNLPQAVYWFTLLAFVLRIMARLHTGAADFWVNGYTFFFDMAQNIAAGKGIGIEGIHTAFRVPLYPIFLAAVTMGHQAFWPIVIAAIHDRRWNCILCCAAGAPDVSWTMGGQGSDTGGCNHRGVSLLCRPRHSPPGDRPFHAADSHGGDPRSSHRAHRNIFNLPLSVDCCLAWMC